MDSVSVKIAKLDDGNFMVWKRQIKALMIEKGYWKAVVFDHAAAAAAAAGSSGSTPANVPVLDAEIDQKAVSMLVLNVSAKFLYLIKDDDTAASAWKRITDTFASQALAREVQLKRELNQLTKGKKESVSDFICRAEKLREQLLGMGSDLSDDQLTMHVLAGLPSQYDTTVEILQDTKRSIPELLARLQLTESRLQRGTGHHGGPAADGAAMASNGAGKWCSHCKVATHNNNQCWALHPEKDPRKKGRGSGGNQPSGGQSGMACHFCGSKQHLIAQCKKAKEHRRQQEAAANPAIGEGAALVTTGEDSVDCMIGHDGAGMQMEAAEAAVSYWNPNYDVEDFMLETTLFEELSSEFGPFTLDGASDAHGSNSHCEAWCSKHDDFCSKDLRGQNVWVNPPFRSVKKFVLHYLSC